MQVKKKQDKKDEEERKRQEAIEFKEVIEANKLL
jgi:hypothetical protein